MMKSLPTVFRNTIDHSITLSTPSSKFSLLWLHGLGDSSEGFYDYFLHPLSPLYHAFRIKLIQAPERFMKLHNQKLNSWYNIKCLDRSQKEEEVY